MSKTTLRAGTSPFAHLLSALSPRGRKAEDEQNPDNKTGAEDDGADPSDDEEARKARRAEEDERRQQEDARRAEEDEQRQQEDARRAEEDETDPTDDNKSGKRGKKAEDSDEPDEDEQTEQKAEDEDDDEDMCRARREGFAAGQARGRRIFSAAEAGKRPDVAAHLAFNETMPSSKAIAMLKLAANGEPPTGPGSKLGRRMAKVVIPNPGTGDSGTGAKTFGQMARAAAQKAGILPADK